MNALFRSLFFSVLALSAALIPTTRCHSQLAPASSDPVVELQAIQSANDDLLKRQDATLKDLTEMNATANELRIFSRRG